MRCGRPSSATGRCRSRFGSPPAIRPRPSHQEPPPASRPAPRCPTAPMRSCRSRSPKNATADWWPPPPRSGACIRRMGEDVAAGELMAAAGTVLSPAGLAALASAGVGAAALPAVLGWPRSNRQRAGVGRHALRPGQIYESNLTAVTAQSLRAGAEVTMAEVVRDDPKAIADALASALGADVVISSGGVSVGPHDYVKPALVGLGVEEVFWRVATSRASHCGSGSPNPRAGLRRAWQPGLESGLLRAVHPPGAVADAGGAMPVRPVARLARSVKRLRERDHAMRSRSRGARGHAARPPARAGVPPDRPRAHADAIASSAR